MIACFQKHSLKLQYLSLATLLVLSSEWNHWQIAEVEISQCFCNPFFPLHGWLAHVALPEPH